MGLKRIQSPVMQRNKTLFERPKQPLYNGTDEEKQRWKMKSNGR